MGFPSAVRKHVLLNCNQILSLSVSEEKLLKMRVGKRVREVYCNASKNLALNVDSNTNQV